jgi:hypothetical protein
VFLTKTFMHTLYNPNLNIKSLPTERMSEIKNHFERDANSVLDVSPNVYKMNDSVGATFRFNLKDSEGLNTGKQWSFWTTPVELAFEDFRGNHHSSTKHFAADVLTDSKRKLSFNMGYLSQGMAQKMDEDHGKGASDVLLGDQKRMHACLEDQLAFVLGEIHRLSSDKSVADMLKAEHVSEGVAVTMVKELKKKHNKDLNVFSATAKGCKWELNDNGICTVFNNWVRTFSGGRSNKTPYYPNILDCSGDLPTDRTPDLSAYTDEDGAWQYNEAKDPHIVKRGQLVKLQLTPCFYATKNGAKGFRFKIQRIKILKQSPYGEKRSAEVDWGTDDDLNSYGKRARTESD